MHELREAGDLAELSSCLETLYGETVADQAAVLCEEYPTFWDEQTETFTGPMSTNAIKGGNWRLKYGLRTLSARVPSGTVRTALLAIHDSIYVF